MLIYFRLICNQIRSNDYLSSCFIGQRVKCELILALDDLFPVFNSFLFSLTPLGLISSTFYEQLFYARRFQKTVKLLIFIALSGSMSANVACRILMKLTPQVNLTNIFTLSYYAVAPKSIRIQSSCHLLVSFYAFGIYASKSCQ
jgi:hypothetical protein